ncbi:MAG: Bug family tripartite tricarboxylate transporter substrate binding protein [Burkholderiales bacterium]
MLNVNFPKGKTVAALAACVTFAPFAAIAQAYPAKPVRIITQFAAGSGGDLAVRIAAAFTAENLGQPMVVENRAGGGGMVAAEAVARSPSDGYNLLAATPATQVMRVFMPNTSIDPVKDFQPITAISQSMAAIISHPNFPANNMAELVAYAKKNPGKISFGTSGIGTEHHLSAEQISTLAGINMVHVPYKSGIQAMNDVIAGQMPISFSITGPIIGPARAGKLKVIAVVSEKRYVRLPDVGTVLDGVPGFVPIFGWTGLFAPAGLPQPVLRRLSSDTVKAITSPEGRTKLFDAGFDVLGNTPEEFTLMIQRQIELVGKILKTTGLKLAEQ